MKLWAKLLIATALLGLTAAKPLSAQGQIYSNIAWRYTPAGDFPAGGATITVCTSSATGTPCAPTVTVYQDSGLTMPVVLVNGGLPTCSTSPQIGCLDGLGNFSFYVTPGSYTYTVTGSGLNAYGPIPFGLSCVAGVSCIANPATSLLTLNAGLTSILGTNSVGNLNNVVFADQQTGADACAKITASFGLGNIVNATGFTGNQTCATGFNVGSNQILYLGDATFIVSTQIQVFGSAAHIYGNPNDSIIKASGTFPTNTAVVQIGTSSGISNATVEGIKIDCSSVTNCIGGENIFGQEQSGFFRVTVANFPQYGFWYEGTGAQNSSGRANYALTVGTTAVGVYIHNAPIREWSDFTQTSNDGNTPAACVVIDGTGGNYDGIHCDKATIGIDIGPTSPVSIQRISNVTGGSTTPTLIQIANTAGNRVILMGISSNGSATNINDILDGSPASASYEPFWAVGQSGQGQFRFFQTPIRAVSINADLGTHCTNGELALSAGWQSTGTATATAVQGNGQVCSWTITTGTTTAANPTITDALTNPLPDATTQCWMKIDGGTHTAVAGEAFHQTTYSATAPVFTSNFTPTANGFTYFVTRGCGP